MMPIEFEVVSEIYTATQLAPVKGSERAGAFDLKASESGSIVIKPGEVEIISTGIAVNLASFEHSAGGFEFAGLIIPRSGLGFKHGIIIGSGSGLIDADYRGEIKVCLWNRSSIPFEVMPLDRIAQMIIMPTIKAWFVNVDDLGQSKRGVGGFGSTGK